MKAVLIAALSAAVAGAAGYAIGKGGVHRANTRAPDTTGFFMDTLPRGTAKAMSLRSERCRILERSAGEFERARGITKDNRVTAYDSTYRGCWLVWIGNVTDAVNWPDATELIVEDSLGGRVRLNVGGINLWERDYLRQRWFIAYFGRLTGQIEGVPLVADANVWPSLTIY